MRVILVRHGESEGNQQGMIQGRLESPLTARGLRQCLALAAALSEFPVTQVYTSPALRAQNTAGVLAGHFTCPITTDERLHERHFGLLQGLTLDEARRQYPAAMRQLSVGDPLPRIPQGESVAEVSHRLLDFFKTLPLSDADDAVAVVTHGAALEILLWQLKGAAPGEELSRYGQQNCSYSLLAVTASGIELQRWGIGTHLLNVN